MSVVGQGVLADVEGVLHEVGGALVGAERPCRHQLVAPVPLLQQGGQAEARLFGVAGLAPQNRPAPSWAGIPTSNRVLVRKRPLGWAELGVVV